MFRPSFRHPMALLKTLPSRAKSTNHSHVLGAAYSTIAPRIAATTLNNGISGIGASSCIRGNGHVQRRFLHAYPSITMNNLAGNGIAHLLTPTEDHERSSGGRNGGGGTGGGLANLGITGAAAVAVILGGTLIFRKAGDICEPSSFAGSSLGVSETTPTSVLLKERERRYKKAHSIKSLAVRGLVGILGCVSMVGGLITILGNQAILPALVWWGLGSFLWSLCLHIVVPDDQDYWTIDKQLAENRLR